MAEHADYERARIEALLCPTRGRIRRGTALYLCPEGEEFEEVFIAAVAPALRKAGIEADVGVRRFDSDSPVSMVLEYLVTTEVLVADLTGFSADLMYVMGLAHGVGRCPMLISRRGNGGLPFDLALLRGLEYERGKEGMVELREGLGRWVRNHLANVRAVGLGEDD